MVIQVYVLGRKSIDKIFVLNWDYFLNVGSKKAELRLIIIE